ncbi:MAG: T9SS type A sorting domain-containing protein [Bacteroidales bacterium]|nr:T9SS type A sorting domain-containing protein [Bacteroidales bacterium]
MRFPVFAISIILIFSQSDLLYAQRNVSQISPLETMSSSSNVFLEEKNLIANFSVMHRFGVAPMSVQFKDMSEGDPIKWTWTFGDGQTDTVKNPLHIYQEPGSYTIKLTILDETTSNSLTRENYITVTTEGACDTIAYPLEGDYTYYEIIGNGSGYVSGNNSYGDLAKASVYDSFEPQSTLIGGIFEFAIAKKSLASDLSVSFLAWEGDGVMNSPSTVLAEVEIPISQIVQEVEFEWSTAIFFSAPPAINNLFFLGVELPQVPGDTLALLTNYDGDVENGNGWEQHDNGNWYPYSNSQYSWNINIDHAIFPLICHTAGISNHLLDNQLLIYPIPATDKINVMLLDPNKEITSIALIDITGRVIYYQTSSQKSTSIDVGNLKSGLYVLRMNIDGINVFRKVMVGK